MEESRKENPIALYIVVTLIVCVGVLLAIYLPSNLRARAMGRLLNCQSNLKTIATALEHFSSEHEGHYPESLSQLVPKYLESLPKCPAAEKITYRVASGPDALHNVEKVSDYYLVWCAGDHHREVNQPSDSPSLSGPERQ